MGLQYPKLRIAPPGESGIARVILGFLAILREGRTFYSCPHLAEQVVGTGRVVALKDQYWL